MNAGPATDRAALRNPLVARTIRAQGLPARAVPGVARITGSHTDPGEPCSPWARMERVHLDLDDVHALALPIPCDGRLGPWRVPLAVYESVLLRRPPYLHNLLPEVTS